MNWKETYKQWRDFEDLDSTLKEDLASIEADDKLLEDAFYQPLSFGTAGMRGILGAGINRMNIYTIRQATEGLAKLFEDYGQDAKDRGVAIAYDSRHMSPEFAMESAKTLGAHGIKSYVFESLRPTPELSFAVRELNAFAGIMITASHNPADYNGYKVYGEDGGQMPPVDADAVTANVRAVENPLTVEVGDEAALIADGTITIIGEEIDQKYLDNMRSVVVDQAVIDEMADQVSIVYTPLHGTGQMLVERTLADAGFTNVTYVTEQKEPDADFSTVQSPNPEEAGAFEVAERYGEANDADILIATDPDADRMGAAVKLPNGDYQVITGNQIAALMTHYILTAKKNTGTLPDNGVILKSIVSSEMPTTIAKAFDVETVNVLTGFKFIAEKIKNYEADGSKHFLFGFEESYGYLVKAFVRDKDAVQATLLLAEVAAFYKKRGKTAYDGLQDLFTEYGTFQEKTISVTLPGQEGAAKIEAILTNLRGEGLSEIAGQKVVETEDYLQDTRQFADGRSESLGMEKSNVLKYYLADETWIAVRPSGTEPKIKFYIGVVADSPEATQAKIQAYEAALNELTA
ncbi:phospho-sugar mutase [Aerococcus sp. HMSC10H05]|uniref:phospho-sugar mutase n=1 Tax=Aerococcus sp. HMSC10H05 TaxID=1581084 RepID=UPI0008A0FFAE|nr:phospho-sugar mutase [Aerococcus sp. HMSC10H05]OFU48181.1 phosphoglucomutase [Aerococcus sp. HMSC10H05]